MLLGRQVGKEPRDLEGPHQSLAHPADRTEPRYVLVRQHDGACIGTNLSGHQIDERGLAGAVRADQCEPRRLPACASEILRLTVKPPKAFDRFSTRNTSLMCGPPRFARAP